ncbi:hypothetical protein Tco_0549533 [Tanacetum coccineum]
MSTRSSSSNLIPPFSDPESVIRNRRRILGDPSRLLDFKEINMNPNNVQGPPPVGLPPQNHNGPPRPNLHMPAPDLRTMEELCQLHGLLGDDANKHLDKFLTITQSMKQNGVTDDALRLYLFPYSNNISNFPPSMVTKIRNDISNFRQLLDESLFKAWECYKLLIDWCPNHNMLPVNVAAGGTFMKRRPEECYDLIENMTAHHNDWDTSAHRGESSSSTTSSSEIAALA